MGGTFTGHLVSPSLFKQGHLKHVCPGPCEDGFGISPRRETAQPPRVTCAQCLVIPPIPHVQNKAPVFQFVPVASALVTGLCWKDLHPLCPSLQVLIYKDDIFPEPSFLHAKQSQAFPHRTDAPVHSSPLWTFGGFSTMPMCPLYCWAQNWTQDSLLLLPYQCWIGTSSHFQTSRKAFPLYNSGEIKPLWFFVS